jgi:hypothetical protein
MLQGESVILNKNDEYRVTDRTYEQSLDFSDLIDEDIKILPNAAVVVDIGSGVNQRFSQGVKELRPDIKVVSIDPTLSLKDQGDFRVKSYRDVESGKLNRVDYSRKITLSGKPIKAELYDPEEMLEDIVSERLNIAQGNPSTLAAFAPDLPLKSESVDLIIETHGPFMYELGSQKEYIDQIVRVLKVDGQARIYPLDSLDEFVVHRNINGDERNKLVMARVVDMFAGRKDVDVVFYEKYDPVPKQIRLGMKIIKKNSDDQQAVPA